MEIFRCRLISNQKGKLQIPPRPEEAAPLLLAPCGDEPGCV